MTSIKRSDLLLLAAAKFFSSRPILIIAILVGILAPIPLIALVPMAGPALMFLGLFVLACGLGAMSGLCIRQALRLQELRRSEDTFGSCISASSVVMAWAGAAITATVGAFFLVFLFCLFPLVTAS